MVGSGASACPWMFAPAQLIAAVLLLAAAEPANGLRMPTSLKSLFAPLCDLTSHHHKKCIPTQVHLAVTGKPDEMRVSWKTQSSSCPSTVHYGETAVNTPPHLFDQLEHRQGNVKTYSAADMCASPARDYKYDTNFLHDVVLSGLVPRTWYSYKVAHSRTIMTFQAPPPPGRKEGFQFLAYGDMGDPHHRQAKAPGAKGTVKYTQRDVEAGADLIFHVGDIAYANGREYVWNSFMDAIEPAASRVPYMVAVGNHEYDYKHSGGGSHPKDPSGSAAYNPGWGNFGNDSGGECGVSIASRFSMPGGDAFMALPPNGTTTVTAANDAGAQSAVPTIPSSGGSQPGFTEASGTSSASQASQRLEPQQQDYQQQQQQQGAAEAQGASGIEQGVEAQGGAQEVKGAGSQEAPIQALVPGQALDPGSLGRHAKRANPPFWYSFDYGSVHFTAVSSEHDLHKHSPQYKWLKRDLKRVDRCKTPWVVLIMHRPMYVVFPHKSNRIVASHLRKQLEQLLNKHEVDLVLSGHVHSYARTCNVLGGKCIDMDQGGMTHITLGCGGHKLSDVNHDQPDWLAATHVNFGYGRITVHDGYELTFEFVRSSDGEVHDSYHLRNERADRRSCFEAVFQGNSTSTH